METKNQRRAGERPGQALRVLVLDDDRSTALAIGGYLQNFGCEVAVASTAEHAISLAHDLVPQVLVCDWKLGEKLDGIDAARILQAEYHLEVIFVTGLALAEIQEKLHDLTPVRCFRKPVSLVDLLAAVCESSTEALRHPRQHWPGLDPDPPNNMPSSRSWRARLL